MLVYVCSLFFVVKTCGLCLFSLFCCKHMWFMFVLSFFVVNTCCLCFFSLFCCKQMLLCVFSLFYCKQMLLRVCSLLFKVIQKVKDQLNRIRVNVWSLGFDSHMFYPRDGIIVMCVLQRLE